MLPVLFIAVLSGFALSSLGERGKPVLDVLESASQMVFKIFAYLMRFAPIGAFGALAFTVGQYGITSLTVMQPPSVKKASNTIRPRIPLSRWPATKNR